MFMYSYLVILGGLLPFSDSRSVFCLKQGIPPCEVITGDPESGKFLLWEYNGILGFGIRN